MSIMACLRVGCRGWPSTVERGRKLFIFEHICGLKRVESHPSREMMVIPSANARRAVPVYCSLCSSCFATE
jgi:hypothetical protein